MSRIGRKEIILPAGVELTVAPDNIVTVKGPKGTLTQKIDKVITINKDGNTITLTRPNDINTNRALHGLSRTLIANMVEGVVNGYSKSLEIKGVGFKVQKTGTKLVLNIGLSHTVEFEEPQGIKLECPTITEITVSGIDKQLVGQVAAQIKAIRPVEPYHGYGIRYKGEVVIQKVGKAGAKGKK